MKLKQKRGDFVVEEVSDITKNIRDSGNYKLYLLEKRGMESFYLFSYLSKSSGIEVTDIGYAGLKDKHAVTKQYITIPSNKEFSTLHEENFDLTFLGYVDSRISSGQLSGNNFIITVRDVRKDEINKIEKESVELQENGVPNYFDSQRFGSMTDCGFLARLVAAREYEAAVKLYLTAPQRADRPRAMAEKDRIFENWGRFDKLQLSSSGLSNVINEYKNNHDWLMTYKKIPTNVRKMSLSAYQGYLWNECARRVLKEYLPENKLYEIRYPAGKLTFYKEVNMDEIASLPKKFKTIGPKGNFNDIEKRITEGVLRREGLKLIDFDIKEETGDYFVSREREFLLIPQNLEVSEPENDELNKSSYKIQFSFFLPKGSYATILMKRLFDK